ncbi:MAG: HlyD family type I secretion periplasmic adaptor subunit [Verrucomicrobiales bacterium]|nr:HlyD family type I secretion periplasmic adaptor subunit [Verrucomicrobiales bacterium]
MSETTAEKTWDPSELENLSESCELGGNSTLRPGDIDFVADCRKLIRKPGNGIKWLPFIALACLVILGFWASRAQLEEVTRGQGKVIPSSSVQKVQSLEGGIVDQIFVKEGDIVEIGQQLLQIRDEIYSSSYRENAARRDVLAARVVRLQAEAQSLAALEFPEGVRPELVQLETNLFNKRKADYEATLSALKSRLDLSTQEVNYLYKSGRAVSKVELTRAKKEGADLQGQINTLKTKAERDAMEQYDRDRAELETIELALLRDKDRLDRTLITSPIRGTINSIQIDTVGRVIAGGDEIMDIVPLDESLLIEANVRPSDIAFIRPGDEAMVKFTAYDFSIYGGLKGKVEQMSVDTVTDEQGESFYIVKVRTNDANLGKNKEGKPLEVIPGMVAEVDIMTGKKSVLTYLLKPINRARQRAFRER